MPTYNVKFSNFSLNRKNKEKIAKIITLTHKELTGANTYFAQVIFNKTNYENHYMGGKLVITKEIFIMGKIISGRSSQIKKKLAEKIRDRIFKYLNIKRENIWIYIIDIPPDQMIEYGEILPASGKEKSWYKNLDSNLKKRLKKLNF